VRSFQEEKKMLNRKLRQKLVDYLRDAHAMEQNVLRMLDSLVSMTNHEATLRRLLEHRKETERHERMLKERLDELGEGTSMSADYAAITASILKAVTDRMRTDKPSRNARDAYITEHTEIAAYELIERLALRCGDSETAHLARTIRHDEEKMAEWIVSHWGDFIDLTLMEAGIEQAEVVV